MSDLKVFQRTYYLTPGECNSEQEMPMWLLVNRLIEVATLHANAWGVGYKRLCQDNQAWVLSRVVVEMKEYPKVGDDYTITTWIESYNRHFSERNFEISDENGNILGYARTMWAIINSETRSVCDLSALAYMEENVLDRPCPIEKFGRVANIEHKREAVRTFRYSDIDFNRHVNTIKYICAILDNWPVEFYQNNMLHRFEIAFNKEVYINTEVTIGIDDSTNECLAEIVSDAGVHCRAKLIFDNRK